MWLQIKAVHQKETSQYKLHRYFREMAENICPSNKFGYCKYGEKCNLKYNNTSKTMLIL